MSIEQLTVRSRRIGPFDVSAISLGCMNLSHAYGEPPAYERAARLLNEALDIGYTMLDSAALYGFGANETLLGKALAHRRDDYVLASKCGLHGENGQRVLTNDPATLRKSCEDSLRRLRTEVIDLFYLHRFDKVTPIEDTMGVLAGLVAEGKVRALGLSEVSAETLRRAHAVHPVAAVQTEYSLWTRNAEIAVLGTCREIGAAFVAFSPLARGFLAGRLRDVSAFHDKDLRRNMPRFQPENYAQNLALLEPFSALAAERGCTQGQLALAWLLHRGEHVVPIPGTTNVDHLRENLGAVEVRLDDADLDALDAVFRPDAISGARYAPVTQAEIDTEEFEPSTA